MKPTVVNAPIVTQTQQTGGQQQTMRVVTAAGPNQSIRLLSTAGQTVRLATAQSHIRPSVIRHSIANVSGQSMSGTPTATATLGGKQIILQKPISLVQNLGNQSQIVTLVKTSQGVVLQKQNVQTSLNTAGQSLQPNTVSTAGTQNKPAVVKLVSSAQNPSNKIIMKGSNMLQVAKVPDGKTAYVLKQGATTQQLRQTGANQIIVVTSGSQMRSISTTGIMTSAASGSIVSMVSNPALSNTTTQIHGATSTSQITAPNTLKMIRSIQAAGKPITFVGLQGNKTGNPQIIHVPQKTLTIGGKQVTVQLGTQKTVTIVSSSTAAAVQKQLSQNSDQTTQKIVMLPAKTTQRIANQQITQQNKNTHMGNIDEPATTDAGLAALAVEAGLVELKSNMTETNLVNDSQIEQMDGAYDDEDEEEDEHDNKSMQTKTNEGTINQETNLNIANSTSLALSTTDNNAVSESSVDTTQRVLEAMENDGYYPSSTSQESEVDSITPKTNLDILAQKDGYTSIENSGINDEELMDTTESSDLSISQSSGHEPTESECEAANILTTIKSVSSGYTIQYKPPNDKFDENIGTNTGSNVIDSTGFNENEMGDLNALALAALQASSNGNMNYNNSNRSNSPDLSTNSNVMAVSPMAPPSSTAVPKAKQIIKKSSPISGKEQISSPPIQQQQQQQNLISIPNEEKKHKEATKKWFTVGFFKELTHTVVNYIDYEEFNSNHIKELTSDNIPDLSMKKRINLEPGTGYKFRLRAVNGCGCGPWGEVILIYIFNFYFYCKFSRLKFVNMYLLSRS